MTRLRQALPGLVVAILFTAITLGGFSLAFVEGGGFSIIASLTLSPAPTQTPRPVTTALPGRPTFTPTPTATITPTPTELPLPTHCPPPPGWIPYTIQEGDTLGALAQSYGVIPDVLAQANCLVIATLIPDTIIYLPPPTPSPTPTRTNTPTRTPTPCGPPAGWVLYTIQENDTLFSIGKSLGVTVAALQRANCLTGTLIKAGEQIYVPYLPSPTRVPSRTPKPTHPPSATPVPPSRTPTPAPTHTPTATQTVPPAPTSTASSTPTFTPSGTPTVTMTSGPSATPSPTATPTPSNTPTTTMTPTLAVNP